MHRKYAKTSQNRPKASTETACREPRVGDTRSARLSAIGFYKGSTREPGMNETDMSAGEISTVESDAEALENE